MTQTSDHPVWPWRRGLSRSGAPVHGQAVRTDKPRLGPGSGIPAAPTPEAPSSPHPPPRPRRLIPFLEWP